MLILQSVLLVLRIHTVTMIIQREGCAYFQYVPFVLRIQAVTMIIQWEGCAYFQYVPFVLRIQAVTMIIQWEGCAYFPVCTICFKDSSCDNDNPMGSVCLFSSTDHL